MTSSRDQTGRYHVPNLERGLAILELLAHADAPMRLSDIERQSGFPKNSVFRIVRTLHAHGYVVLDPDNRTYTLSHKLFALGSGTLAEKRLIERSMDVMRALRDVSGETAFLGTLLGEEGVILEQVPSTHPVKVVVDPGTRFPLHTSAPGKCFLAFLPAAEREDLLRHATLTRYTANTITEPDALRAHLEQTRARGYSTDCEEEIEGINCVGAPIFDHRGYPVAALWVTGPEARLSAGRFAEFGAIVMENAGRLSARFGYDALNGERHYA